MSVQHILKEVIFGLIAAGFPCLALFLLVRRLGTANSEEESISERQERRYRAYVIPIGHGVIIIAFVTLYHFQLDRWKGYVMELTGIVVLVTFLIVAFKKMKWPTFGNGE